jgi:hypothetical protein
MIIRNEHKLFSYVAITRESVRVEGTIVAESEEKALHRLRGYAYSVSRATQVMDNKELRAYRARLTPMSALQNF